MERIVELNEYFQYPQILKDDAKLLINQFSNDKIDIYITGNLLYIYIKEQ